MNDSFRKIAAVTAVGGALALGSSSAIAVTESVTATLTFVAPIAVAQQVQMDFGYISTDVPDTGTIIIDPDGTISGGTASAFALGGLSSTSGGSANVNSSAGAAFTLDVILNNASASNGVALSAFTCEYDDVFHNTGDIVIPTACDSILNVNRAHPTTASVLTYGATATFSGNHTLDDTVVATPSFDIVVTYN